MKEREPYLKTAVKKMRKRQGQTKNPDDKRVFPMGYDNVIYIWRLLVKKSGLFVKDSRTKRLTLHPHCLRKFYRSYLGDADLSEHLMGHASSGLVKIYRNMKIEDLAEKYNRYMHNVTIFETSPDLSGLHTEMQEKDQTIKDMQNEMQEMKAEITEMRLERLEKKNGLKK